MKVIQAQTSDDLLNIPPHLVAQAAQVLHNKDMAALFIQGWYEPVDDDEVDVDDLFGNDSDY